MTETASRGTPQAVGSEVRVSVKGVVMTQCAQAVEKKMKQSKQNV